MTQPLRWHSIALAVCDAQPEEPTAQIIIAVCRDATFTHDGVRVRRGFGGAARV